MSLDLFLFCFRHGQEARFRRSLAEGVWAPFIGWEDDTCWELEFPDGGHSTVYLEKGTETCHITINRPAASLGLWAGLFLIMDETGSILMSTGSDEGSFVTNEIFVSHYPHEKPFSPFTVVSSAEELRSYFWVDRSRGD